MRISDWSSDVCSSDLTQVDPHLLCHGNQVHAIGGGAAEDPRLQALDELEVLLGLGDAEREECSTDPLDALDQIGRASCRERVCQSVSNSVVAVSLKKNTNDIS